MSDISDLDRRFGGAPPPDAPTPATGASPPRAPQNSTGRSAGTSIVTTKQQSEAFKEGFARVAPNIRKTLPTHVPFDKFERVTMMAVQREPKLLQCDTRSLFMELQKCAADGLLPDGREAVIVYRWNGKLGKNAAVYQPMVAGLRKLMRNSGEVVALHAQVVYEGEPFRIVLGDEERIEHERKIELIDETKIIGAYAVATMKDGEKVREFMSWSEIEKVRNVNKDWAKGPWASWKSEMSRKSVVRRLFKSVPQSVDRERLQDQERLSRAVERDDEWDIEGDPVPANGAIAHDAFEAASEGETIQGEVVEKDPANAAA